MPIQRLQQPDGSALCGQTCVAMVAGVSLDRAIEAVGHASDKGTYTREIVRALRALGIPCDDRLRVMSRTKPVWPKRCMLAITGGPTKWHWMLAWDGEILDPGGRWPDYPGWKITSYLEIFS